MDTNIADSESNALKPDVFLDYLLSVKSEFAVTRASYISGFSRVELPVGIAYRPNSKVLSQSGGKGISKVQALISALMESYECDAAEKVLPDVFNTSYSELKFLNKECLDPTLLPTTLTDFSEYSKVDWSYCTDIISECKILVPFDAISLDFTRMSNLHEKCYMQLTSNGVASGQTEENAIISALFEIIERHCVTTKDFSRSSANYPICLETLPEYIRINLLDKFSPANITLNVHNLTLFSQFPVYSCTIIDDTGQGNVGWGCHIDDDIAVARAITEANQARTIQISGSREDMHRYDYMMVNKIHKPAIEYMSNSINLCDYSEQKSSIIIPKELTLKYVIELWKQCRLPNPLVKILSKDMRKAAVRVVVPKLHGYNYPAYVSVLRNDYSEQVSDFIPSITHRPAAI